MNTVALIVSSYNQPAHLDRCLLALGLQTYRDFELIIADDGSGPETADVIDGHQGAFDGQIRHLWQEDLGFRKTRILNKAILSTDADYLVFMDGDCIAHPEFINQHVLNAGQGHYLNGAMIRLNEPLSEKIDAALISSEKVFDTRWLKKGGGEWNRRFLRLSLPLGMRYWLNRHTPTDCYWLGANSSCFRKDAVAINGFDNRFTYGFEDGDFGNRLENYGLEVRTVRWTANVLHLWHGRPYSNPEEMARNLGLMTPKESGGAYVTADGLGELAATLEATPDLLPA